MKGLIAVQTATLDLAQALVGDRAASSVEQWAGLAADLVEAMEPLPFNVPCRGPRRHLWIDFEEREIDAIRDACGGTMNDVVLTLVTAAVRKYTENRAQAVEKRLLRIIVPVNLRSPSEAAGTGNRISFLPLIVPLGIRPPAELLAAVHERTQALKRSHVLELINLAAAWLGAMPAPLQAMLGQLGNRIPIAPFHLVCTNVPGPRFPLYLAGRKMLHSYPYVPIGNEMGFCCAVQSYNGRVYFGLTADSEGVPDAERLREFVHEAFEELCAVAGIVRAPVREAQRQRPRRQPANRSRRGPAAPSPRQSAPEAKPKMPPEPVEAEAPVPAAAKSRHRRARTQPVASLPEQIPPEVSQATVSAAEPSDVVAPPSIELEAAPRASAKPRRQRTHPKPGESVSEVAIAEASQETASEANSPEVATPLAAVEPEVPVPAVAKTKRRRARPKPVESVPEQANPAALQDSIDAVPLSAAATPAPVEHEPSPTATAAVENAGLENSEDVSIEVEPVLAG